MPDGSKSLNLDLITFSPKGRGTIIYYTESFKYKDGKYEVAYK